MHIRCNLLILNALLLLLCILCFFVVVVKISNTVTVKEYAYSKMGYFTTLIHNYRENNKMRQLIDNFRRWIDSEFTLSDEDLAYAKLCNKTEVEVRSELLMKRVRENKIISDQNQKQ